MARRLLLLVLLLTTLSAAARNTAPANLDFETGAPGEVPPGWAAPTARLGYPAQLTTDNPKQGKQSVRVSGKPQAMQGGQPSFGNVMQQVDATAFRGKRVRLRGAVRVEGADALGGLWVRVDRPAQAMGFFDNMQNRPIRSKEWAYYEITGDVAEDALFLNFGLLLRNAGTAWLDDVTLEVTNRPPTRAAAPKALTPRGLENLVAFTRLFGIVRHFHPSDEAANADWEAVAVNGAVAVEGAKDGVELAARLRDIFLPLAPTVLIEHGTRNTEHGTAKPANATAVVAWEHHGLGGSKDPRSIYRSERIRRGINDTDARFADPLQPLRVDLGGGVTAHVPLAVFAGASRTLPAATHKPLPHSAGAYTGNDRGTRIGAVVILWNVLQHFYPYFDVVEVDWPAELQTALRAAALDRDERAFRTTLRRMVAAIDDGHGSAQLTSLGMRATLPLLWRVIGDALVITTAGAGATGIRVGDEVIAIDGKPALPALREVEQLISGATPQWIRAIALRELAAGTGSAVLTIRNADGTTRTVTVPRSAQAEPLREKRPEKIAEVKRGIWYVDLERITDDDFKASLDKLAGARGIVFDLRGYPRTGTLPLRHLIGSPIQSARWNIPIVRRPNREALEWDVRGRWSLEPLKPRLVPNIVFLTDGRAISYAESWMGIIEAYKLAEIVGETTAGTNGNINIVELPGGYRVVFTGMKVLKHDGSRHHGIGIKPTVPVSPTLAGIREGRDEQLERAIEILSR